MTSSLTLSVRELMRLVSRIAAWLGVDNEQGQAALKAVAPSVLRFFVRYDYEFPRCLMVSRSQVRSLRSVVSSTDPW